MKLFTVLFLGCIQSVLSLTPVHAKPLNVLFITMDDMSCDSVGVYGCKLPGTTPNMDRLAKRSLRFEHAHVQVGNCMPSRNVLFSGRYPHNNRVEGFYEVRDPGYPVMADLMKSGGWFTGIRGKVSHSTPYSPYPAWDVVLDTLPDGKQAHPKNVASYGICTRHGIDLAQKAGKPFCLVINISDPHKPFYAEGKNGQTVPDANVPSRVFKPEEVPVPGFLPDDPVVRKELAHYYSSVRRGDDCLGEVLAALKDSGQEDNTLIIFLSDHGMPLPFAKTQLYHHSTRTPLMISWPGVTKHGSLDSNHMVSAVDMLPTLLDILELQHPPGLDGRSFVPLLKGGKQDGRDFIVKEYNENSGGNRSPMRAIQTKTDLYLFNPWSNGKRVMQTATAGTPTNHRMKELAKTDPQIAARVDLIEHRVPEEFYDIAYDPDALTNLIDKPDTQKQITKARASLEAWMVKTKDPMLEVFQKRDDPAVREAYMKRVESETEARLTEKPRKRGKKKAAAASAPKASTATGPKARVQLIKLEVPETIAAGQPVTIKVPHQIPADLGQQNLHITIKGADGKRIDRKVVAASGTGTAEATFTIPAGTQAVSFAAFIGEDYDTSLQHVQSGPMPTKGQ